MPVRRFNFRYGFEFFFVLKYLFLTTCSREIKIRISGFIGPKTQIFKKGKTIFVGRRFKLRIWDLSYGHGAIYLFFNWTLDFCFAFPPDNPPVPPQRACKCPIRTISVRFGPIRSVSGGFWRVLGCRGGVGERGFCKGKESHQTWMEIFFRTSSKGIVMFKMITLLIQKHFGGGGISPSWKITLLARLPFYFAKQTWMRPLLPYNCGVFSYCSPIVLTAEEP